MKFEDLRIDTKALPYHLAKAHHDGLLFHPKVNLLPGFKE